MTDTTKHLTDGKPMQLILGFSLPLLVGMLFQQMYSIVDTIIVGKCLGAYALAAVGATGSVNFLINGFCMGVCAGFTIPVAQQFGAQEYPRMRRYEANAIWLSLIFSIVMTALVVIFCRDILVMMNTPADIIDRSYAYIVIIFAGIPVTYLYQLTSGIIRAVGDSKTPVYFLLMASGINIILDLLLIAACGMGVEGAAIGTVISQFLAGISCLVYMCRHFPILAIRSDDLPPRREYISGLLLNGIPMGLQYSITAIGSVILQTAVNGLGSVYVAASTASQKIYMFAAIPFDALGSTMSTYAGQNVGARRFSRLKDGLKASTLLGLVYSGIAFVMLYFFRDYLFLLFLDASETEIIKNASLFLIIQVSFFFPLALVNIIRFEIQGMGFSILAVAAGICEMIARSAVAFTLVPAFGYTGAAFASPCAWILADAFLIPAFFYAYRKLEGKTSPGLSRSFAHSNRRMQLKKA